MHHPEICLITQIIEDYFLLVDGDSPKYELIPITQKIDNSIYSIGVIIKRKLLNGYVYIQIKGQKEDDNATTFSYSLSPNNDEYLESIETDGYGDLEDKIRDVMRAVFILDKNQTNNKSVLIAA
jgi:hypothetical protein